MREIGIFPRFSRDKFVPLQTKQRYSTRDISGEVFLTLFFRGFVPFLSLADFVSRDKNLQVIDLQRLKSCFGKLVTATTRKIFFIPPLQKNRIEPDHSLPRTRKKDGSQHTTPPLPPLYPSHSHRIVCHYFTRI